MSGPDGVIKEGSIVLIIGATEASDTDLIYYCIGRVGTKACDSNRWLVTSTQRGRNYDECDLIWLMDLPADKHDKLFCDLFEELKEVILAAALRQLINHQLAFTGLKEEISELAESAGVL